MPGEYHSRRRTFQPDWLEVLTLQCKIYTYLSSLFVI
jgi:hypothetical protein